MALVLFVDDDRFTLETLSKAVQVFGHQALYAATGEEALLLAQDKAPDLIFVDMRLPDMDGLTLVRSLREQPLTTDIPVLVLSASPEVGAAEKALEAGAKAFLNKPIRLQALNKVIQEYTEE